MCILYVMIHISIVFLHISLQVQNIDSHDNEKYNLQFCTSKTPSICLTIGIWISLHAVWNMVLFFSLLIISSWGEEGGGITIIMIILWLKHCFVFLSIIKCY